jgi:hypothetical protein
MLRTIVSVPAFAFAALTGVALGALTGTALSAVTGTALGADAPLVTGIHVHDPVNVDAAARVGYRAIRLWDTATAWSNVQTYPGTWNFDRADRYLAQASRDGLAVLWTLGNTPRWASMRPNEPCAYGKGCAAEPADIENWRRYVRTVATRYRGRVACYEPWNEVSFPTDPQFVSPGTGGAPGQFFSGSVQEMVRLAGVAYEEIKQADPQACVLSPSFHPSGDWAQKFDRYLAAGGGAYMDVVSQHFYFRDEPEQAVPTIRAMRAVMARHGVADRPLWNTEVGVAFGADAGQWAGLRPEDVVYSLTLRSYVLNAAEGVARVYWYAYDNRSLGFSAAGLDAQRATQAARAAVRLAAALTQVSCESSGAVWRCRALQGGQPVGLVWQAGKSRPPQAMQFTRKASRWGQAPNSFPAGSTVLVDARPVLVEGGF